MASAFALVGLVTASPALATAPSATGWWWVGQAVPVMLAPTPAVPEGGLYVAGGFGQPTGVSALRFELADDVADTLTFNLTLEIAESVGTPALLACPTAQPWTPAHGGAWSERATADCDSGTATATLSDDGRYLRLDVSSLQDDGAVDIVLLPALDQGSSPFSMSIKRPGMDALALQPSPGTDAAAPHPATDTAEPFEPPPAGVESPAFSLPELPSAATPTAPDAPTNFVTAPAAPAGAGAIARGFAYPAVFALPLLLLGGGSCLTWALTRPLAVGPGWSRLAAVRRVESSAR